MRIELILSRHRSLRDLERRHGNEDDDDSSSTSESSCSILSL